MTQPPRVKICGITRLQDAEAAVSLGAAALGFIFWPRSPRAVTTAVARAITCRLPALVTRVGVFVDAPPDEVARHVTEAGLDVVQLHGGEDVAAYSHVGARVIRALSLGNDEASTVAALVTTDVTLLVDAHDPVRKGGTGQLSDWARASVLARARPIILAGGLTPENVASAIRRVRPWAIDVSSGVETAPGIKSSERLAELFAAITTCCAEDVRDHETD